MRFQDFSREYITVGRGSALWACDGLTLWAQGSTLESDFPFLEGQLMFVAEQLYQPISCRKDFGSLTAFSHFFLSLFPSVQAGGISQNLCGSPMYVRDPGHLTASTDLPWIPPLQS